MCPAAAKRLHPKVVRVMATRSGPVMGPPSLPPYAFVVVHLLCGRPAQAGAGLGVASAVRAASGRSPAHPAYPISRRTVGPRFVTLRIWHDGPCPGCARRLTNAATVSAHPITKRRRLRVKQNTQNAGGGPIPGPGRVGQLPLQTSPPAQTWRRTTDPGRPFGRFGSPTTGRRPQGHRRHST